MLQRRAFSIVARLNAANRATKGAVQNVPSTSHATPFVDVARSELLAASEKRILPSRIAQSLIKDFERSRDRANPAIALELMQSISEHMRSQTPHTRCEYIRLVFAMAQEKEC